MVNRDVWFFCAGAWASSWRTAGSSSAVNATSALTSVSHSACCWVTRPEASALLARASAAVAGGWKPASADKPVRRAVSARDAASDCATTSCAVQVRCRLYDVASSAATATRASCHKACAPSSRAWAASLAARLAPNRSISHAACNAPCVVVAMPPTDSVKPRWVLAAPSTAGSSAAPAVVRVARACSMRERADAMPGLACCAASISCSSTGSSSCVHHCDRSPNVPAWGSGACHWTGMGAGAMGGGAVTAHAASQRGAVHSAMRRRVVMLFSPSGWQQVSEVWLGLWPGGGGFRR